MALFADDVAAWVASRSLKVIELRLQKQFQLIEIWMNKWRTKISVAKTVYTTFNKRSIFIKDTIHLSYNGQELKAEKNFKFLGINLDPKLSFTKHTSELVMRAQHSQISQRKDLGSLYKADTN